MKSLIALFIILVHLNAFSQPALELEKDIEDYAHYGETGVYYKDFNDILTSFEGRYVYTNGTTSFEIILRKMEHSSVANRYFEDRLIGGYRYVENGVVKVDVLNDLNNNFPDGRDYVINGNHIVTGQWRCQTCLLTEKWILGRIDNPVSGSLDELFIRKIIIGGQAAIKIKIYHSIGVRNQNDPPRPRISYPVGQEFILIKQ